MTSNKKRDEALCLEKVIEAGELLDGESKRIIARISGQEFRRQDTERPDFVKYYPPISKQNRGTLIGIEHFRVDRLSIQKRDGKVASTGIGIEKAVKNIYEQWHELVLNSEVVPEGAISDVANLVALRVLKQEKSSYSTFIKSFEYSLNKHLESVDAYNSNLQKLSAGKYNVELVLLIEIHAEFGELFFNDHRGVHRKSACTTPIFGDMVRLMEEKIDCHKVNYIILCIGGTLYTNPQVIVLQTSEIKRSLERQNIFVYEYAGEDLIFSDFQVTNRRVEIVPKSSYENHNISIRIKYMNEEQNEQEILEAILYSFQRAFEYRQQGKNFVATYQTQKMLDVYGDFVIGWQNVGSCGREKIEPIFVTIDQEEIEYRENLFDRKWLLQRNGGYNE